MPLHPDLNNLTHYCRTILALDTAQFVLSGNIGAEKNSTRKMLLELSREEVKKELDIEVRKLKTLLERHFKQHESALWTKQNDPSQT